MRVLVTGGAGYIGSHVVRALQQAKHTPIALDDLSTGHVALAERNGVELLVGDVADPEFLEQVFSAQAIDAVIHCAGRAIVAESVRDPGGYFATNTLGGYALLEAMRRHSVWRIVFSSSCTVYGIPDALPITEHTPREPVNPYGASKLAFEHMLLAYARAFGFKALSLRYFNVAGASSEGDLGEMREHETHLIPLLLRAAHGDGVCQIHGTNYATRDGSAERDYVHVEDLARAHVQAVGRLDIIDPLAFGCALNIGLGHGYTVREVISSVERLLGCTLRPREVPRRPGDPPALVSESALARRVIGFAPQRNLEDMIRSADRFYQQEAARTGRTLIRPQGAAPGGPQGEKRRFGESVVDAGYVRPEAIERALEIQRERSGVGESHKLLGLILLEMGELSSAQLIATLQRINA